jgi:serine/threonine protein kinase/Tol biopolymer transport system component
MGLSSGTKLGPYEIESPLGAGGMGEVYRARDTRLARAVAIKILPPALANDADRLQRFQQEARILGALNHANLLAVYDVGVQDGVHYLVSEFLEGQTLRTHMDSGPLPLRRVLDYSLQLAGALAAAHDKGIVHRDLKPENVFITADEKVKILDFGLSKQAAAKRAGETATLSSPLTEKGMVLGTVGYMSPEQVRGEATDQRSDIFSFGAILYEMVSGRRAFKGDSQVETMNAILHTEPPELAESSLQASPGLQRILQRCLEKAPQRRFQSASDLAFSVDSLSQNSGVRPAALAAAKPKRQWLLPIAAALLLVGLGISADRIFQSKTVPSALPYFQQLTFKRGTLYSARFTTDGKSVIYSSSWDAHVPTLYTMQPGSPESRPLDLQNSVLLSVSSSSELAILLGCRYLFAGECAGTLARVPLSGGGPREIAADVNSADWSADGSELAVTRQTAGKFQVEFPLGKVLYQATGGWLRSARTSPRGDAIAFVEHPVGAEDQGRVLVIDRSGNVKLRTPLVWSVEGIAWSPQGDEVWVGESQDQAFANEIHGFDLSGRDRVILRLPGFHRLQDVSRDGRLLVSRETWKAEAQFRGAQTQQERDLSWLDYPVVTDISPDGSTILFSEEGEAVGTNFISYMRKPDGSPAVKLGVGGRPVLSPDGKWVVVCSNSFDRVVLLPTGTGEPRTLGAYAMQRYASPGWMPAGKEIYFAGNDGHGWRIYTQNLGGAEPRAITPPVLIKPETFESNLLSPDGKLFFARDLEGKAWLYPIGSGEQRAIPGMAPEDVWIGWARDNRSAYVLRWAEIPGRLQRLDLATGRKQPLAALAPADRVGLTTIMSARITPDARFIVYTAERALSELYLVSGMK